MNQSFYQTAVQLSFGCLVTLDNDGVIMGFNSFIEAIPEDTAAGFTGQKLTEIFIPVDKQGYEQDTPCSQPPAHKADLPKQMLTRYADKLYIEWKMTPVEGDDAETSLVLGSGIDVTDYIELKQQLHHVDRLATVGQLAAGIAHEINGPLNNILGYAQLSAKQQDLPEQVYQDLDNIIRMSLHAREVVKKVMLFSRQVPPKPDRVDLNEVIRESLYFTEPLCGKNNIRITCRLDDDLPALLGDTAQLRQVVVNLVVNAVQAMPGGNGEITITTAQANACNRLTLKVEDNGAGMTEETLSKCFDPFFTTKALEEGTGLGLSVVHGIIKAHNADMDVTSREGEGTCFTVTFSAAPVEGRNDAR
ncbi:MAG: ATP-binding protein [Desulfobacterales bacterium]|nr:ATP-binding protein [Desulfobacterales bacterium]